MLTRGFLRLPAKRSPKAGGKFSGKTAVEATIAAADRERERTEDLL